MGHVISGVVKTYLDKVTVMVEWPRLDTIKELRSFLGLTRYYRKFTQHYRIVSKPLTELLKKDNFHWNPKAEATFLTLKRAMT